LASEKRNWEVGFRQILATEKYIVKLDSPFYPNLKTLFYALGGSGSGPM
jgi:hypothetical protein